MKESIAIENLIKKSPELSVRRRGLPETGIRNDGKNFYEDLNVVDIAFKYSNSLYAFEERIDKRLTLFNAGAGSPMRTCSFPPAMQAISDCLKEDEWSQYQIAAGDIDCRKTIADYLNKEGFYTKHGKNSVDENNVIFTSSTTEGFYLLLKVITRPYDVILFTGPTYGLFMYIPERIGAISKIVPLKEEDDWLINPRILEQKIMEINQQIKNFAIQKNLTYEPRVVGFLNINPSNPTGKVMTNKHIDLLLQIGQVCKVNGVFLIDDIIYRELCFDASYEAVPMATLPNMDGNIITLMGASKAYGLAAARAGMVIADEKVIRGIRNHIFQQMDSSPLYVGKIMKAIYNNTIERDEAYTSYFANIRSLYLHKWILIYALVAGLDAVEAKDKEWIYAVVNNVCGVETNDVLKIVPQIKLAKNIIPESGFFVLLDFSDLKGMHYNEITIETEQDVLYFYYLYAYVKLLMGKSIGWTGEEFIARVSFALDDRDIILMIKQMKDATRKLAR